MKNKQDAAFIGCDSAYEKADIVVFGAPFDSTTSFRPGARFAPKAMRADSFGIESYSLYQDRDLCDCRICDEGDLDLPFGNVRRVVSMIEETTADMLNDRKIPVMIGGEHLVSLGSVKAAFQRYPSLQVIHFDAHADLRNDYLGETLSHATVMRRIWDLLGDGKIHQYGIRSGEKDEFAFARTHTNMQPFTVDTSKIKNCIPLNTPVYVTLDLDVLDTAVFPGTGTPEPGGVSFRELLDALLNLKGLNIVGLDLVELAPVYDASGVSTAAACKILRELLLILGGK